MKESAKGGFFEKDLQFGPGTNGYRLEEIERLDIFTRPILQNDIDSY